MEQVREKTRESKRQAIDLRKGIKKSKINNEQEPDFLNYSNNRVSIPLKSKSKEIDFDFKGEIRGSKYKLYISPEERIFSISPYVASNYEGEGDKIRVEELRKSKLEEEERKRKQREEMERKKRLKEEERKRKEAELRKKKEEEERKRREMEERRRREEEERKRREEYERLRREEEERLRREEEERLRREEEERLRREEEEEERRRKQIEYEERKKREEEERKRLEEERLRQLEEEARGCKVLTFEELNVLIQSFNEELYETEKVSPMTYDRIVVTLKVLSEVCKKMLLRGLKHGIRTQEHEDRYNIVLGKYSDKNIENEERELPNEQREYNEEEY